LVKLGFIFFENISILHYDKKHLLYSLKIEIENNEKIIRLPKATLRLSVDGILFVRFAREGVFDLEDCCDYEAAICRLCPTPTPVIIDGRAVRKGYITNAARDYLARSKSLSALRKSNAFLVNSLTTKLMAKAYVIINRPNCPAKIFSDEQEAVEWSKRFL